MIRLCLPTLAVLASVALAHAAPAFKETFDGTWEKRWLKSSWKESEGSAGEFTLSAGKWYGDAEADKGIQTGPDARFFTRYTEVAKPFDNTKKDLVIQFSVKNEQKLDCGGGYIKLIPDSVSGKDMESFGGDTPYSIMFGPDICGFSTKRVHVIFNYKGKNHLIKKDIPCETDEITHVYTLIVRPDNTYEVFIDTESKAKGSLFEDWDMLPPRQIKDPDAKKPEDWDDRAKIEDPEDVKPEGYDDIPETISDPDAKKPDDWDDEDDGEWEPPTIPNPEYKGEWKPKMIDNPAYKGTWEAPMIDNPEFTDDPDLYKRGPIKYVGFELWQVKSGTIFDNIMLTDSLDEALAFAKDTWGKSIEAEKAMKKSVEEAEKAAEDAAKAESSDSADDNDDDDDEDEDDEADEDEDLKEEL